MITKEQLDAIRKSEAFSNHERPYLLGQLCDEIEALMAKPSTPNPHAEFVRNFGISCADSPNGINAPMLAAADEIDRLTKQVADHRSTLRAQNANADIIQISKDGDMWCALIGEDLQVGIAAFGETPGEAVAKLTQTDGFSEWSNNLH